MRSRPVWRESSTLLERRGTRRVSTRVRIAWNSTSCLTVVVGCWSDGSCRVGSIRIQREKKRRGAAEVFPVDLADPTAAARLPDAVIARLGRLDAAFNNAGVTAYGAMDQLTVDDFDRVMAANVRAVCLLVKHEVAAMRAAGRGGAIVNTSSIAATGGTVSVRVVAGEVARRLRG